MAVARVTPSHSANCPAPKFTGKTFAFTGRLTAQENIFRDIERAGGKRTDKFSAQLDFLIVGKTRSTAATSDEKRIARLNEKGAPIEILSEEEYARFAQHTKFPRYFRIPAKMTWRGKGPRPGVS